MQGSDVELQAGPVGDAEIGTPACGRDDFGGHDQGFGAFDQGLVALPFQHPLAFDVGQPLGQCGGNQYTEEQSRKDTARHRAEERFHAAGSTVTCPAST